MNLTRTQVAELCGVTTKTIDVWRRENDPMPSHTPEGKKSAQFDANEVLRWYVNREMSRLTETPDGEIIDMEYERARLTKEQADKESLMNAQRRRELAPIDLLQWTLGKVSAQINSTLTAVPLKIKRRMPDLTTTEIDLIRKEIVVAQNAASRITVDLDEYSISH